MPTPRRRTWWRHAVNGAAGFYRSGYGLNRRVDQRGLPAVAWRVIAALALVGTALSVVVYLSSRDWLATLTLLGVTWPFVVMAAAMGDAAMRQRPRR